jgi:hypothetical protein
MDPVSINYINNYHCKTLQNLPKFGFFGLETNHLATLVEDCILSVNARNFPTKTLTSYFWEKRFHRIDARLIQGCQISLGKTYQDG